MTTAGRIAEAKPWAMLAVAIAMSAAPQSPIAARTMPAYHAQLARRHAATANTISRTPYRTA